MCVFYWRNSPVVYHKVTIVWVGLSWRLCVPIFLLEYTKNAPVFKMPPVVELHLHKKAQICLLRIVSTMSSAAMVLMLFGRNSNLMTTSSNGNIFRVTGTVCGESIGKRWIPLTNASLWCFLSSAHEQTVEQTIETAVIWDAMALIKTSL